jgi:protein-S-isoprenylcysteine O-methyltransferase Ste14
MSRLLVCLQFILIGAIAWPWQPLAFDRTSAWFGAVVFAAGLAVFFSALFTMPMKTFTVMPEPKAQGELVTRGIYGVVRHPMYLAVLLCAVGAGMAYGSDWKWGLSCVLGAVLWIKLRREEKMLLQQYADYAAYRARTAALVPFLL